MLPLPKELMYNVDPCIVLGITFEKQTIILGASENTTLNVCQYYYYIRSAPPPSTPLYGTQSSFSQT